jgi:hypothetical protein
MSQTSIQGRLRAPPATGPCLTASLSAASGTLRVANASPECISLKLSVKYNKLLDKWLAFGLLILPLRRICPTSDLTFQNGLVKSCE